MKCFGALVVVTTSNSWIILCLTLGFVGVIVHGSEDDRSITTLPFTDSDKESSNYTLRFTNLSDINAEQRKAAVTFEFRLNNKNDEQFDEAAYRRLRKAILDALNKHCRRTRSCRRRRRTTTTSPQGTTVTSGKTTIAAQQTTAEQRTTVAAAAATTAEISTETIVTTTPQSTRGEEQTTMVADQTDVDSSPATVEGTTVLGFVPPDVFRKRRRRDVDDAVTPDDDDEWVDYTEEDLHSLFIDPQVKDGVVRATMFLEREGEAIDPELLLRVAEELRDDGTLEDEVNFPVVDVYLGIPDDSKTGESTKVLAGVDWRFFLALILIIVVFVILLLAIVCIRRRRSPTHTPEESKLIPVNSTTPNGSYPDPLPPVVNGPKAIPDGDGYIVPYQIMVDALSRTEVPPKPESTKL